MSALLADIIAEIEIEAPADRVWRVMTDPQSVAQWLGCLQYEKRVGCVFYMQQDPVRRAANDIDGATHCEILALEEPRRFAFSWFLPGVPKTFVAIDLEAASEKRTTVRLSHAGWDQFDARQIRQIWEQLSQGWSSFVLPSLKKAAEAG